jgi:hypothetical protein
MGGGVVVDKVEKGDIEVDGWCVVGMGSVTGSGVEHAQFAGLVIPGDAVPWISKA